MCFPFQYQNFYALNHKKNCVIFLYRAMIVLNISWLGRCVFFFLVVWNILLSHHAVFSEMNFYFDIFVLSRFFLLNFHFYHFVLNVHSTYTIYRSYFFSRFWIIADYFELIIFEMSGVSFDANEIIQDLGFSASQLHRTSLVVGFACAYSFLYMGCSVASLIFFMFSIW